MIFFILAANLNHTKYKPHLLKTFSRIVQWLMTRMCVFYFCFLKNRCISRRNVTHICLVWFNDNRSVSLDFLRLFEFWLPKNEVIIKCYLID